MKRHVLFGYLLLYFAFFTVFGALISGVVHRNFYSQISISPEQYMYYNTIAKEAYFEGLNSIEDKNIQISLLSNNKIEVSSIKDNLNLSYNFEDNNAILESINRKGDKINIFNPIGAITGAILALALMCRNAKYYF